MSRARAISVEWTAPQSETLVMFHYSSSDWENFVDRQAFTVSMLKGFLESVAALACNYNLIIVSFLAGFCAVGGEFIVGVVFEREHESGESLIAINDKRGG